eukprot:gene58127-79607_t
MALREIIILPDKQLRLVSKPIEKVTAEVRKLADDMFETMYEAPGIGLAAIQIAEPLRLITMDLAKKDDESGPTKAAISTSWPGDRKRNEAGTAVRGKRPAASSA